MKNQVIEVLDVEHGKKVIEYWRGILGRSALLKEAIECKSNNMNNRYYGIIDGVIDSYTFDEVQESNSEIIELTTAPFTPNEDIVFLTHEKERLEKELKEARDASESFATVVEQQDRDIKKLSDEVKIYVHERESMVDHINKNNKVITELNIKNEGLSVDKDYWFNEFNKIQNKFRKFKNAVQSVVLFIDDSE